ncbi:MAG TPA: AAA family ATPase [Hymenobacter sp.]|jgi:energy-coupling factor transporter ATP-binding protein EcfA2
MAKMSKPVASPAPQPPYIKRAHLRNVPPLRNVKVDFKPGLNIIIGKNGSGKTNFMKLLSELIDLQQDKFKGIGCEVSFDIAGQEVDITFKESKAQKKSLGRALLSPRNLALSITASNKKVVVEDKNLFTAIVSLLPSVSSGKWGLGYEVLPIWHGLPNHQLLIVDRGTDLSFDNSGGMSIVDSPEVPWQLLGVLERSFIDSMVPYDVGSPANQFASIESGVIHKFISARINARLGKLNAYLPTYSPIERVRLGEQFQVYPNSAKDEIIVKGLMLEYLIGGDWLPFSALSDGTKRIFYLIGELATKEIFFEPGSNDSLIDFDLDKIIFLEEPELGIHPDQLQLLLQLIREVSKEHQVIMTTHSPQTLDMLSAQELDRITICEFIPGKGTQMRKLSAAKKAKAKAYLRDNGFLSEFWRFSNLEDPD